MSTWEGRPTGRPSAFFDRLAVLPPEIARREDGQPGDARPAEQVRVARDQDGAGGVRQGGELAIVGVDDAGEGLRLDVTAEAGRRPEQVVEGQPAQRRDA